MNIPLASQGQLPQLWPRPSQPPAHVAERRKLERSLTTTGTTVKSINPFSAKTSTDAECTSHICFNNHSLISITLTMQTNILIIIFHKLRKCVAKEMPRGWSVTRRDHMESILRLLARILWGIRQSLYHGSLVIDIPASSGHVFSKTALH